MVPGTLKHGPVSFGLLMAVEHMRRISFMFDTPQRVVRMLGRNQFSQSLPLVS